MLIRPQLPRFSLLAALLLLLAWVGLPCEQARAAEPFIAFENDGSGNAPDSRFQSWHAELEPFGSYGESWFFLVQADDGGVLFALSSVTNLGLRTFDGSYDLEYYEPDGTAHRVHQECRRDQVRGSTQSMDMYVGASRVWGGGKSYHMSIQEGGVVLDLNLENVLSPYKFGDGKVRFGEDLSSEWTLSLDAPRARSSGSLTIDGKTFDLAGNAYHDHGWATIKLPDFLRKWFTLRIFDESYTVVLHHQYFTERYGKADNKFGLLGRDDRIVAATRNFLFTPTSWTRHSTGKDLPASAELSINAGGYQVHGTISDLRLLDAVDVLAQLSWPVRTAIRAFYSDVWLIRLLGRYELDVTDSTGTRHISGQAIVEANYY